MIQKKQSARVGVGILGGAFWVVLVAGCVIAGCGGGGKSGGEVAGGADTQTTTGTQSSDASQADVSTAESADGASAAGSPDAGGNASEPVQSAAAKARDALTEKCERSADPKACGQLGGMMMRGEGGPRAYTKARTLTERGCKAGDNEACADAAQMLARGHGGKLDAARAHGILKKSCDASHGRSCGLLGIILLQGNGLPRDPVKGTDLIKRACEMGHADSCHTLGDLHADGLDVPPDLAEARRLYLRACEMGPQAGAASSCQALANLYAQGRGVPKDATKAAEIIHDACEKQHLPEACLSLAYDALDRNDPAQSALPLFERTCQPPDMLEGCRALALLHIEGRSVPRDTDKGLALLQTACDLADATSCERLGQLYSQSKIVPRQPAAALAAYQRACDLNPFHCESLALVHEGGVSPLLTTISYEKAASLREASCEDHPGRCVQAAKMFAYGGTITQNIPRAVELYTRACDADPIYCEDFATLYTTWQYVSLDLARALPLFERACWAGQGASCTQAGELLEFAAHMSVTPDPVRALALHKRACALGDARGCLQLVRLDAAADIMSRCDAGDPITCERFARAFAVLGTDVANNWPSEDTISAKDRARDFFKNTCDKGHYTSCEQLGVWHSNLPPFQDPERTPDLDAAATAYQSACDGKIPSACRALAALWLDRTDDKKDPTKAAAAAKQACDLGDLGGCVIRVQRGHLDGLRPCELGQRSLCTQLIESVSLRTGTEDPPTRLSALLRACDLDYGHACRTLASIHSGAEGPAPTPTDPTHDARYFLEKACAAGDELSCSQVDLEYDISLKAGKHIPRAVAFYEASCARKKATSCRKLADLHSAGTLITRDPARMISLYEQACDAGDATACAQLGREFQSGTSTPADPERARALFLKGCQHDNNRDACLLYVKSEDPRLADACISGDNASCTALETGFLYVLMETDKAVSDRFRPQFLDFYRRRCDAKQPAGCRGLGNIYRDAAGVPQDLTRARQLHEKACILEHVLAATADSPPAPLTTCYGLETLCGYFYADQASCVILGGWYDSGIILSQDTTRATEFFRQACTMGWSSPRCSALAPAPY